MVIVMLQMTPQSSYTRHESDVEYYISLCYLWHCGPSLSLGDY